MEWPPVLYSSILLIKLSDSIQTIYAVDKKCFQCVVKQNVFTDRVHEVASWFYGDHHPLLEHPCRPQTTDPITSWALHSLQGRQCHVTWANNDSYAIEGRKEMFYLTTHSTHFIYGYMASDIWLRTILIVRKETCCRHMGYSLRLTARVLLYAPSHRQDNTYHSLCYTSRGALPGTRNSSMGPPHEGSIRRPTAP